MNKLFILVLSTLIFSFSQTSVASEVHKKKSHSLTKKVKSQKVKFSKRKKSRSLRVTATAYNSLRGQTDRTPNIAAWGDRLRPGMRVIAVSRDLLTRYGLKHNTLVRIQGHGGTFRVKDKMNKRYRKRIDIYMGKNRIKARRYGKRKVTITW